jgi:hypothetical protein
MVLFDTDQVQAPMTAHWLVQMGWEVYLLKTPLPPYRSPDPWPPWPVAPAASRALTALTYLELKKQHPVMLIDCDDSRAYRREHLREAHWITRSRIPDMRSTFDAATWYVFTSADGQLAAWAAGDAQALGGNFQQCPRAGGSMEFNGGGIEYSQALAIDKGESGGEWVESSHAAGQQFGASRPVQQGFRFGQFMGVGG